MRLLAAAAVLALAGCSVTVQPSVAPPTPQQTDTPDADGATKAWRLAIQKVDAGDRAGEWDMWSAAAQAQMPKQEYINLTARCAAPGIGTGVLVNGMSLLLKDSKTAYVPLGEVDLDPQPVMVLEGGRWKRIIHVQDIRQDPCMEHTDE